ncbi:MAG: DNA-binding response regulator [Mycobacteriaceae bacterium]|nr:DNA-binding response regulator [Mycobacteriaceae bacterium]
MEAMRQRILVVDDDPSLAEMLTIVLRNEGFETAVIGDGSQALTAVRELRPDLVPIADIDIDVPAHKVTRDGEQIQLTPLEFDLLVALARKPRQVFTRDVLLEQVWGYRHPADTRLVNVHVQRLRAKVEKDPENPQVVLTVRGVGYKAGPP